MNTESTLTKVITVSEKEVQVAHHSGLIVPLSEYNRVILWAPCGDFDDLPTDSDDITYCPVTKYTRKRLRDGGARYTHDPDVRIVFELEDEDDDSDSE